MTLEEARSGMKPSVHHFKILDGVTFMHIFNVNRKNPDVKSTKCIHLGSSEESKAYKLYDPISNKIFISTDVVFEESNYGSGSRMIKRKRIIHLTMLMPKNKTLKMRKMKYILRTTMISKGKKTI